MCDGKRGPDGKRLAECTEAYAQKDTPPKERTNSWRYGCQPSLNITILGVDETLERTDKRTKDPQITKKVWGGGGGDTPGSRVRSGRSGCQYRFGCKARLGVGCRTTLDVVLSLVVSLSREDIVRVRLIGLGGLEREK